MKTTKQLFELFRSKTKDGRDFEDKHVVHKTDDANGNGDEVFKGSKVKPVDRKKTRLGYNPGEDEKVYEGKWDYPKELTRTVTRTGELSPRLRDARRDFRKAAKAKAHAELMKGGKKVDEELTEAKKVVDPSKLSGGKLQDMLIGADHVQKNKDGTHTFYRRFFYRSGSTSEGHANRISKSLNDLGIKHDVIDHETQDFRPFRGGASVKSQNHHKVTVKIHPGQNIADKYNEYHESFGAASEEVEHIEEKYVAHLTKDGKPAGKVHLSAIDQENAEYSANKMVGNKPYRGYKLDKVVKVDEDFDLSEDQIIDAITEMAEIEGINLTEELFYDLYERVVRAADKTSRSVGKIRGIKNATGTSDLEHHKKLSRQISSKQDEDEEHNPKAHSKKAKNIRESFLNKYVKPSMVPSEDRIQEELSYLSQAQINTVLDLYEQVDALNKAKIMNNISNAQFVEDLVDFAITHRDID